MTGRLIRGDTNSIKNLVAEDGKFERIAPIDRLNLYNYEGIINVHGYYNDYWWLVVAAENGRLAQEELFNEHNHCNLVLLDLMTLEMVKPILTWYNLNFCL